MLLRKLLKCEVKSIIFLASAVADLKSEHRSLHGFYNFFVIAHWSLQLNETRMPTTKTAFKPLPSDFLPAISSTDLIKAHLSRVCGAGSALKVIARNMGVEPNYLSMLKSGECLALPRILAFAKAARLSDDERRELLHTRLMELHGEKGEFCVETLVQWSLDLFSPAADEQRLMEMWREATEPAPHLLGGLLDDPEIAERVVGAMHEVVQSELRRMELA